MNRFDAIGNQRIRRRSQRQRSFWPKRSTTSETSRIRQSMAIVIRPGTLSRTRRFLGIVSPERTRPRRPVTNRSRTNRTIRSTRPFVGEVGFGAQTSCRIRGVVDVPRRDEAARARSRRFATGKEARPRTSRPERRASQGCEERRSFHAQVCRAATRSIMATRTLRESGPNGDCRSALGRRCRRGLAPLAPGRRASRKRRSRKVRSSVSKRSARSSAAL